MDKVNRLGKRFGRFLSTPFRQPTRIPQYSFKYIPPKDTMRASIVPYSQWKGNRIRSQSQFKIILLGIAFLCCAFSRIVYLIIYDDYIGYYYQVNYPILSRSIELVHADIIEITDPIFDIVPKNRFQIPQIFPRLYELVAQKQRRIAEDDQKVLQLRKQMEAFDEKHRKK